MQPDFAIVYDDRGRDMHGTNLQKPLLDPALAQTDLEVGRNVSKSPSH